jgi:uncharacterized protein (TIGR02001 family)
MDQAAPASPHTLTGNVGLFSSYRFRGIDQTAGKPALQGGLITRTPAVFMLVTGTPMFPLAPASRKQSGNGFLRWLQKSFGDFGIDVGGIYYYYPGSDAAPLSGSNAKNVGRSQR